MKMRIPGAALSTILLVAAAAAPAQAADKETRQMMADIRILQEQSQQLQNLLASMTEAIKAVNARIDEQTGASRKSFLGTLLTGPDGTPRPVDDREDATTALTVLLAQQRVWGIRVHDVRAASDALRTLARYEKG